MSELKQESFREGFTFAHLLRAGHCNECEVGNLEKCVKPEMRRFTLGAVGINLLKIMEGFGLAPELCKPVKTESILIFLLSKFM